MTRALLSLILLPVGSSAKEYGPFCQWHRDPTTSMAIQWIATGDAEGEAGTWRVGAAGFGYGDDDDQTLLRDMRGNYRSVYIRRPYEIPADAPEGSELTIGIRYDDAFILYLDGKEVQRKGVEGSGATISSVTHHEAEVWEYFKLGPAEAGQKGVIAIEGHNQSINSSDFTLRPRIDYRANGRLHPVIREGAKWAYLAGAHPRAGWKRVGGLEPEKPATPRYRLAYRPKSGGTWADAPLSDRRFGSTSHRVFGADLRMLQPATRYVFKIARWGTPIGTWEFETAPLEFMEGMSFVTGGDMLGSRTLLDAMNTRAGRENPLFALLGGDLAYANGVDSRRWLEWVDSWNKCAVAPDGRLIPMIVVIGNHEVKGAKFRPTNAPGRDQAPFYYSLFLGQAAGSQIAINFGNYLSIIGLDSGHTENISKQTQWLGTVLGNRIGIPRQFVCYHRPAWGVGVKGDAEDIRREWSPLFEQFKVDCVFENDHHTYKRTHPLLNGKRNDRDGVLYLGDGAWGVQTRRIPRDWKTARPYLVEARAVNHLIKVSMKRAEFVYEAMTAGGDVFDRTTRPVRRLRGQ